jgi:hypothetical protein
MVRVLVRVMVRVDAVRVADWLRVAVSGGVVTCQPYPLTFNPNPTRTPHPWSPTPHPAQAYTYKDMTVEEMRMVVMENYDTSFASKVQAGDVLVAGYNFGTGSSREQVRELEP